ncbi:rhomboid-domain-containing protein [Meredithblackwellia eburnea MCA 4105]
MFRILRPIKHSITRIHPPLNSHQTTFSSLRSNLHSSALGPKIRSSTSTRANQQETPIFNPEHLSSFRHPTPSILPHIAFCLGLSTAAFVAAAQLTNDDTKQRLANLSLSSRIFQTPQDAITESRIEDLITKAKQFVRSFPQTSRWPTIVAESWVNLNEGQRTAAGIIATCSLVFGVWQIPALRGFSKRFLMHHPLAQGPGKLVTHLTCIFSHQGLLHFSFNSIALWSIGPATMLWLQHNNPELRSTSRYEFVAFFVAAGLISSLASHLYTVLYTFPRVMTGRITRGILPSLGASGAIYAAFAVAAMAFPQASVTLIFLPFIPIPIGAGFAGMVALDLTGLIRGWQVFDHAAHLGGAAAGLAYFKWGHEWFEEMRKSLRSSRWESQEGNGIPSDRNEKKVTVLK